MLHFLVSFFLLYYEVLYLCWVFIFQISGASVEETLVGEVVLSILKVTVNKPALFTCLASNRHSAGANTVKATARITVAGKDMLLFPFHNKIFFITKCHFID